MIKWSSSLHQFQISDEQLCFVLWQKMALKMFVIVIFVIIREGKKYNFVYLHFY